MKNKAALIYHQDLVWMHYHEAENILHLCWEGFLPHEEFVRLLYIMLGYIHELGVENCIIDARRSTGVGIGDQSWITRFFVEEVSRTRLRKVARLTSDDIMYEAAISFLLNNAQVGYRLPFSVRNFDHFEDAMAWIKEDARLYS